MQCQINPTFSEKETFIPKLIIKQDIRAYKNIRLIQLLNWPVIKHDLYKKYPMISNISLKLSSFPTISIHFTEKLPWLILIEKNKQYVIAKDGTLLNKDMLDVELPKNNYLFLKSIQPLIHNDQLSPEILHQIKIISKYLNTFPLFNLQQIIINDKNIQLIEAKGFTVNLGPPTNFEEKFKVLVYFLGYYRKKLDIIRYIDVQFPNQVIVK